MIKKISLVNFKKHEQWLHTITKKIVILHGDNATGKTSILEAISLFSPGVGLFNHDFADLLRNGSQGFEIIIDSGFKLDLTYFGNKKELKINSVATKTLDLLEYTKIYGLNPYIALAFWKDSAIKRNHINRLIMQNDSLYPVFYAKYNKALKERSKIIASNQFNSQWAKVFDPIIIENGVKIAQIQEKILNKIIQDYRIEQFLGTKLQVKISPTLEEQMQIFSNPLTESFIGPHRTKFEFFTEEYNQNTASTAEQKKMLIALTIAGLPNNSETTNILLLDDLFTTLDQTTIEKLINTLQEQEFQTWITHTLPINMNQNIQNIAIKK